VDMAKGAWPKPLYCGRHINANQTIYKSGVERTIGGSGPGGRAVI